MTPTPGDLERAADEMLAADLRSELCRDCGARGVMLGPPIKLPVLDAAEKPVGIFAVVARYVCEHGHVWHDGEGKPRGRGGESPILLDEHYAHRKSKEAYTANGIVDEFTSPGMFHRAHIDRT